MESPQPDHKLPLPDSLRWLLLKPQWLLTLLVVFALGPFLAKPFNMDDPLFVWAARQIQEHPGDPYGFKVNWNDTVKPMWEETQNPPLACYYVALSAAVLGWNEFGLHLAFLLPAVLAILGTYRLARQFCDRPLLAALATLFTPVFLVSATSVMCDVLMLCLWVWAVIYWLEGLERKHAWRLLIAAALLALATVTKYFAVSLVPLLFAFTLISRRRLGLWCGYLLVPVVVMLAYGWWTQALYGKNLLLNAGDYATSTRARLGLPGVGTLLAALGFTGGCLAVVVFMQPWLWRKRVLAVTAGAGLLVALLFKESVLHQYRFFEGSSALLLMQMAFWAVGGVGLLALAVVDVINRREAKAWLLALWLFGTFIFAAFVNWTINGRSILPMAPAAAILLARRVDQRALKGMSEPRTGALVTATAGAALALLVTRAEYLYASAVEQVVEETRVKFVEPGRTLWFFGHWGFQYYMETIGAVATDSRSALKPGDLIALPDHNPTTMPVKPENAVVRGECVAPGSRWLATMNDAAGAGFYGSFWGPLPFAFGRVPPERVVIGMIVPSPGGTPGK